MHEKTPLYQEIFEKNEYGGVISVLTKNLEPFLGNIGLKTELLANVPDKLIPTVENKLDQLYASYLLTLKLIFAVK